jgi:glycosyltransferase involved in cell wall biosynthesis
MTNVAPVLTGPQAPAPDIYLMAFACEPGRGSEPGVGYVFAHAADRLAIETGRHVVLVTRPHRVAAIRAALADDGGGRIEILPVALPSWLVRLTGRSLSRIAYVAWQFRAVGVVRRRIAQRGTAAIVHHVTFATEGMPTFEWRLRRRAALVFGPAGSSVAGVERWTLWRALRRRFGALTLAAADVLIAQNSHVAAAWRAAGTRAQVLVEPNVVIAPRKPEPVVWDAASIGGLIPRKRTHLAIEAFAAVAGRQRRMAVIGEGPLLADLQALAARLGVADRIVFFGDVPRAEALEVLAATHTLLHASSQEGAGWVVGEAQASGAHPIVVRGSGADVVVALGGAGTVVDDASELGAALAASWAAPVDRIASARWAQERLPAMLTEWYRIAADIAADRLGATASR